MVVRVKSTGALWGKSGAMCMDHANSYAAQVGSVLEVTDIEWVE